MKSVSQLFGVGPDSAAQLERSGVRSILDLAQVDNLEQLSGRAGVPKSLLEDWRRLAQTEVEASRFRRRVMPALGAVILASLAFIVYRSLRGVLSPSAKSYSQAVALYQEGKDAEAASGLDQAFAHGTTSAALHNLRGLIYLRVRKLDDAAAEFQKALGLDANYADAWNNLGTAHRDLRQTDRATKEYEKAVALKPQVATYHHNLALLWEKRRNLARAETEYKAAVEAGPSEIESYTDLSNLYQREGNTSEAEGILLRATTNNPRSDAAYAALASFYFTAGRYPESAKAYQRAAELAPEKLAYWQDAGDTFREGRKWDEALSAYGRVLERQPDDWNARFQSGWILLQKGEPSSPKAIEQFKAAIAAAPSDGRNKWCYLNLAIAYSTEGQSAEADRALTEALRLDASFVPALIQRAFLRQHQGQYGEGEKLYRQAIHAEPWNTVAYYDLWWLYRSLSRSDKAQGVFRKLQSMAPGDEYSQLMLAQDREDKEDFSGAVEVYSRLRDQNPEDPQILANLAAAEIKAGMKNQDRRLIQKGMHRLEQEVTNNPTFFTCFTLAWAYQVVPELRDQDKAAQLYQKALNYEPDNLRTLDNLAALTLVKGDFQGVISESRKALSLNPRDVDALENLGYGQFLAGDLHGAIESYEKAMELAPDDPVLRICYGEALFWSGDTRRAHEEFAHARDALSRPAPSGGTWIWLIDVRYDATEKQRAAYYSTILQKRALVELLEGLTYLREIRVPSALERYRAATGLLTATREDKEIVRKGINDLHRLRKEPLAEPTAELGLGYLFGWLGDREQAVRHWSLYLESGTDPDGLAQARRGLAGSVAVRAPR